MIMSKLVQKVKWNLDGSQTEMYMYGETDFEANKAMQEPLGKLYKYESQPDLREKVMEYIDGIESEIKRLEDELCKPEMFTNLHSLAIESRMETLQEVVNDLKGRLEERI